MKENNIKDISPQELIKRYVYEVGRFLPKKERQDICRELYSTLNDMFEERGEENVLDFIQEQGSPRKKAATYYSQQYLIGPELFPAFRTVVRIVLPVIIAAMTGALIISGLLDPEESAEAGELIPEIIGSAISGTASAFGFITLVFIILQRTGHSKKLSKDLETWHPKDLLAQNVSSRINLGEQIVRIIFTAVFIILVNLNYDTIGGLFITRGTTVLIPSFSDGFIRFVPALSILWGLTIALSIVHLITGKIKLFGRIAEYVLKGFSIALAAGLLTLERLFIAPEYFRSGSIDGETVNLVVNIMNKAVKGILVLVIVLTIIDIVKFIHKQQTGPALPFNVE